jgi:site-specific DNA-methyltransferase (adenine-specific)
MFELNKVYNECAVSFMKRVPDECFDLIVTDCPYKIIAGGIRKVYEGDECGGVLNKRDYNKTDPKGVLSRKRFVSDGTDCSNKWIKKGLNDVVCAVKSGKMFDHNDIKFNEWLPELYRVLKKGTHCYIMVNSRNLKELQIEAEKAGFEFQNLLVWDKGNRTPNKYYMQQVEYILMLSKRPAKNINDMGSGNLITIPNIIGNKVHPTEKPVALMKHLIKNSISKGEIIYEPFAGSGSACVAAKELSIDFVATEIDSQYCEIANTRIYKTGIQKDLF